MSVQTQEGNLSGNASCSHPLCVNCPSGSHIDLCEVGTAWAVCPASVGHDPKGLPTSLSSLCREVSKNHYFSNPLCYGHK